MISEQIDQAMNPIKLQIEQIPNLINQNMATLAEQLSQANTQNLAPSTQAGPSVAPSMPAISPEAIGPVMTGLAQILQAWKGNTGVGTPDPFGEMFKQLGINIMQAGVDGIYKQVYDGYQPKPRNATLGIPQPPNNQPGQSTGFRQ